MHVRPPSRAPQVMEIKQEEIKRLQAVQAGQADAQLAAVNLSTQVRQCPPPCQAARAL